MMRVRTIEWQVCGACNYDCSYCIQKKSSRTGHPSDAEVARFLEFFRGLDRAWEVKMTGGEPFAFRPFMERIVPGLVSGTRHTVSVLTNLSAPAHQLEAFAEVTRGRLHVVSASFHAEHTTVADFVAKARLLRDAMDPRARLVVNAVMVPGRLDALIEARRAIEDAGLALFPQVMKVGRGIAAYGDDERDAYRALLGQSPTPADANVAPSYRGRLCWAGAEYFVLTQTGDAWRCRTARRFHEGYLGNVLSGTLALSRGPEACGYDICPCTVPANRGMIEGIA